MALLDDVKSALRISTNDLDVEVQDLIDAAIADLQLSGVAVDKVNETDPLIKRAVIVYCKANFDTDNQESDRLAKSYELLKMHLTMAEDYNSYAVVFTVTSDGVTPIDEARITVGDETKETNSKGVATFMVIKTGIDVDYVITATGYLSNTGSVYIDGSKAVVVSLTEW